VASALLQSQGQKFTDLSTPAELIRIYPVFVRRIGVNPWPRGLQTSRRWRDERSTRIPHATSSGVLYVAATRRLNYQRVAAMLFEMFPHDLSLSLEGGGSVDYL
jgi:hypothetical protein